jgi:hypothetical protein
MRVAIYISARYVLTTTIRSVVITCCGHSFGTECFKRWRNTCFVNHRDTVGCPTCRKSDPDTTCFVLHSG